MIRSFLTLVSVALFAASADAQFAYPLPAASTCSGGQCRPVQAVTGAVHAAVVAGGETFRQHVPALAPAPAYHQPAGAPRRQPVRTVVRRLFGR